MAPFPFLGRAPKPDEPDLLVPTPISQQRLIDLFRRQDWHYFIDSDGDLGGQWDDVTFYFFITGSDDELLVIRSQYPGTIDPARVGTVRDVLEDSHRRRPFPKSWYRMDDEGQIRVMASNAFDCEMGATDDQLLQHVRCSIGTSLTLYESMNEALGR